MLISPFGVNTDISEDRSIVRRRWDSEVLATHVFNCKKPVRLFGCNLVLCFSTGIVDDFPVVSTQRSQQPQRRNMEIPLMKLVEMIS
jgi:hypothetical protein